MDLPTEFSRLLRCKLANTTPNTKHSDKIYLPASYLASLLDSRNRTMHQNSRQTQAAVHRRWQQLNQQDHTSDISDYIDGDSSQLPSPLIFRLVRKADMLSRHSSHPNKPVPIYCGVREFSCEEDHVALPEWLLSTAGLAVGDSVSVEFVRPEKGTFAQLQALEEAANNVGDLRALLESHMRTNLTALSIGETFKVPVGGIDYPLSFSVTALEPMDAVDIVDTDLSVDIVHTNSVVDSSRRTDGSSSIPDELVPGSPQEVVVSAGQSRIFQLHIPAQIKSTDVFVSCQPGEDASICASRIIRNVNTLDNTWFDCSPPSQQPKQIHIDQPELPSGSNTIFVAIVGFTPICRANIKVQFDAQPTSKQPQLSNTAIAGEAAEKTCENCGSNIPLARFTMHQAVCERHNIKCPHCARVFKRGSDEYKQHWHCEICNQAGEQSDQEKHMYFYHQPQTCSCNLACSYESRVELAAHRRTDCPERLIECRYCHIVVPQGPPAASLEAKLQSQHEHEWDCGNRSIPCAKCKAYVGIRQVQTHMKLHEMKEQIARANMVPCANRECTRERADNPLGLCGICFGPLYSGQYDPDNQKLLKRLARNLHVQLINGCGSKQCRNPHCASGRANSGNSTSLSQTEAAAKLVPVLKAYAPLATATNGQPQIDYSSINLHLCV
ncbi:hypothetical protein EV183_002357 [Coemansia sp. RSA 2336]|nr:hypothetical protein EV183_002357 [Coemansia sp. RSA 2336]